jgi:MFS family permease
VVGLWLAASVGLWVGSAWRTAYLVGVVPALLVLWVRTSIKEPDSWREARATRAERLGSFRELLGDSRWRARAVFGALLAMAGLATFWGVVIAGQNLAEDLLQRLGTPTTEISSRAKVAFGFVQTTGAGLGMLAMGPLMTRFGRRRTFAVMHAAALVTTLAVCWLPGYFASYAVLLCLLPVFGFFAQGFHAGYAVYFPELFPTHLRATGAGFCFNTGRILAAPVLIWLSAWMKAAFALPVAAETSFPAGESSPPRRAEPDLVAVPMEDQQELVYGWLGLNPLLLLDPPPSGDNLMVRVVRPGEDAEAVLDDARQQLAASGSRRRRRGRGGGGEGRQSVGEAAGLSHVGVQKIVARVTK